MILIIGGAYQGKLAYALDRFNLSAGDVYRCGEFSAAVPEHKKMIYEIDKWILALIKADEETTAAAANAVTDANADTTDSAAPDPIAAASVSTADSSAAPVTPVTRSDAVAVSLKQFIGRNPDAIVICNDISCGVVPYDAIQRKCREAVGRSLAELSRRSDEVIRLFCGIPSKIK